MIVIALFLPFYIDDMINMADLQTVDYITVLSAYPVRDSYCGHAQCWTWNWNLISVHSPYLCAGRIKPVNILRV